MQENYVSPHRKNSHYSGPWLWLTITAWAFLGSLNLTNFGNCCSKETTMIQSLIQLFEKYTSQNSTVLKLLTTILISPWVHQKIFLLVIRDQIKSLHSVQKNSKFHQKFTKFCTFKYYRSLLRSKTVIVLKYGEWTVTIITTVLKLWLNFLLSIKLVNDRISSWQYKQEEWFQQAKKVLLYTLTPDKCFETDFKNAHLPFKNSNQVQMNYNDAPENVGNWLFEVIYFSVQ